MEAFFTSVWNYLDEMDFVSQKRADTYHKVIIVLTAIISFIYAYQQQQFSICVYSTIASSCLCMILFVPAWPCWKRNQLNWHQAKKNN